MFYTIDLFTVKFAIGTISLVLSWVFFLIPIPVTTAWCHLRQSRNYLVLAYTVLGMLTILSCQLKSVDTLFSGAITVFIACYQALLYTMTCILFLKPRTRHGRWFWSQMAFITLFGSILIVGHWIDDRLFNILFFVGMCIYTLQLVYYCRIFVLNYRDTVRCIEYAFEEDMSKRLRLISRCFYSALVVGMMAWLMAVLHASEAVNVTGMVLYTLYYVYMLGCFIRYVINYSFIMKVTSEGERFIMSPFERVEAVEVGVSPKAESNVAVSCILTPEEEQQLVTGLAAWVSQKKFCEMDLTVDDIVLELKTTRRKLFYYLTTHHGGNFRSWRNRLRIEEAKRLLSTTDTPTSELHQVLGFTDRSNFHRLFRETVGVTPTQYRKEHSSV